MITAIDVEQEISSGNQAGLQTAFRALIGYPGEDIIQGADSADILLNLPRRVSYGLLDDETALPGVTMELLRCAVGRTLIGSRSYSEGARIVLQDLNYWHVIFARELEQARRLATLAQFRPQPD